MATATLVACSSTGDGDRGFDDGIDAGDASPLDAAIRETSASDATIDQRPEFDPSDEPVVCAVAPCAVQLVAGERHFCARMSDGAVRCWGSNANGALGIVDDGSGPDPDTGDGGPSAVVVGSVTDLSGVTAIAAAGATTCAVIGDGGVRCWGADDMGQLGRGGSPAIFDYDPHPIPAPVALPGAATRVDVGPRSACAVLANEEIWCWGDNTQLLLARRTDAAVGEPAKANLGAFVVRRTAAGTSSGFGVTDGGELISWGAVAGPDGVVGGRAASMSPDARPLSIKLGSVTSLAVSSTTLVQQGGRPPPPPLRIAHACAVTNGELRCWGASRQGALGTGFPDPAPKPTRANVNSKKGWPQQVAAAGEITCVRLTDGTVQCAGDNSSGAIGEGPETDYLMFFVPVSGIDERVVQVVVASGSVCALAKTGRVVCWGSNANGELGRGTTDQDPHPVPATVAF
ncbi:hypothetical protein AKJ09_05782 [Labilithrix luteola]|uniref:BNR repeat domain protein n=1 Tax=Labilithrix luteola TaxID=1391654 RepID=A0A0K1Q011_9BACT|nr:hypothetical protein AKJ09_05782 [Labilithrix luteola]